MKKTLFLGVILSIVFLATFVLAVKVPTDVVPSNGHAIVNIPSHAVEVSPGVFDLGLSFDEQSGKVVQGYAFTLKSDINNAKGGIPGKPGNGGGDSGTSSCYGFIAKGTKWKVNENYIVDTSNIDSLEDSYIRNNLDLDIQKWEDAASYNIIGNEVAGIVDIADVGVTTDGKNEIFFADISGTNTIGLTIVWGIFGGPLSGRQIVEVDQIYNDFDFDWTQDALIETTKMDFESIATHELGHTMGMDDLYTSTCSQMTMYGYGSEGETYARTLEDGDINGISRLY